MKNKILFVHIPKVAGSSVNKFFADHVGLENCAFHLESNKDWLSQEGRLKISSSKKYISGHFPYWDFQSRLDLSDYFVFSFMRNPLEHVISHLSWIRRLADPSEKNRFNAHPEYIKNLALKMKEVDFESGVQIEKFLNELSHHEFSLLDNVQVRYLRSNSNKGSVNINDVEAASININSMDDFGLLDDICDDLKRVSEKLKINAFLEDAPKENVLSQRYGMSINNSIFVEKINKLIKFDEILFKKIEKEKIKKQKIIARIDRVNQDVIAGWARYEDLRRTVDLNIFVNDIELGSVSADLFRSDLNVKFKKKCAFVFKIPEGFRVTEKTKVTLTSSVNGDIVMEKDFQVEV